MPSYPITFSFRTDQIQFNFMNPYMNEWNWTAPEKKAPRVLASCDVERVREIKELCTPWELRYFNVSRAYHSYVRVASRRFPGYRWRFHNYITGNISLLTPNNRVYSDICFHVGHTHSSFANVLMQVLLVKNNMDDLIVARANGEFPTYHKRINDIRHSTRIRSNIIKRYVGKTDETDEDNMLSCEYDD